MPRQISLTPRDPSTNKFGLLQQAGCQAQYVMPMVPMQIDRHCRWRGQEGSLLLVCLVMYKLWSRWHKSNSITCQLDQRQEVK